jgi:CheY-like chemotaxis protein
MDGTEAIDAFDKHPFDLVILDRAMPGLSGDQVAAAIRSTSQVPIVMLTGFGDQMIQNNDIPGGVNRVISKPVTIAQLRQAIGEVQP